VCVSECGCVRVSMCFWSPRVTDCAALRNLTVTPSLCSKFGRRASVHIFTSGSAESFTGLGIAAPVPMSHHYMTYLTYYLGPGAQQQAPSRRRLSQGTIGTVLALAPVSSNFGVSGSQGPERTSKDFQRLRLRRNKVSAQQPKNAAARMRKGAALPGLLPGKVARLPPP